MRFFLPFMYKKDPKKFEGNFLQVEEPVDPLDIKWNNFNYSFLEKLFRRIISTTVMIGLLVLTFYGIRIVRLNKDQFRTDNWVQTDCSLSKYSFMTEIDVVNDYLQKTKLGYVECYCNVDPIGLASKVFDGAGGAQICNEWVNNRYTDLLFSVQIAAFIVLVNNLFRIIFNSYSLFLFSFWGLGQIRISYTRAFSQSCQDFLCPVH